MWTLPTQEEPIQVPENNQADDEPKQWERLCMDEITPNPLHYADMKTFIISANKWYNRRLRMYIWKRWKRIRTRLANLQKCGIPKRQAWQWANTRKGYWRISKSGILTRSITNERLISAGYPSILNLYIKLHRS